MFNKARLNQAWIHHTHKAEKPQIRGWLAMEDKMVGLLKERFKQYANDFDYKLIDLVYGRFAVKPEGEKQGEEIRNATETFLLNQNLKVSYTEKDIRKIQGLLKEYYLFGLKEARKGLAEAVDEFISSRRKLLKAKRKPKPSKEELLEIAAISALLGSLFLKFTGEQILLGEIGLSEAVILYLEGMGGDLVLGLEQTQRNRIGELIANGIRDGEGLEGAYRNLRNEFSEWEAYRARLIARTELANAIAMAKRDYNLARGIKWEEWLCGLNPCDICLANCGKIGNTDDGAEYPNPGLPGTIHPRCVCEGKQIVDLSEYQSLAEQYGYTGSEEEVLSI